METVVGRIVRTRILAIRDAVRVGVRRRRRIPRARILAVDHAVSVGVHPARVDTGVRGVVGARIEAIGRSVAVPVRVSRIARARILAVADTVVVGIDRARVAADPGRAAATRDDTPRRDPRGIPAPLKVQLALELGHGRAELRDLRPELPRLAGLGLAVPLADGERPDQEPENHEQ
jgi:hypothetical protein